MGSGYGTTHSGTRRMQGKGSSKSGALYKIAVTTGDKKGAATDAKVLIITNLVFHIRITSVTNKC